MGRTAEGKTLNHVEPINQLRHWHKAMARFAVAAGQRPSALAKAFGITETHASRIMESPLFLAEMARLESLADYEAVDMSLELKLRQQKALATIDEVFQEGELPMRKDMALEILDRTGYGKRADVQKHLHLHKELKDLSDPDLDKRIESLLDARASSSPQEASSLTEVPISEVPIDVEFTEIEAESNGISSRD